MKILRQIALILVVFCIALPAHAMDADHSNVNFFGRIVKTIKERVARRNAPRTEYKKLTESPSDYAPLDDNEPIELTAMQLVPVPAPVPSRAEAKKQLINKPTMNEQPFSVDYVQSELLKLINQSQLVSASVDEDKKIDTFILADCANLKPIDFHGWTQLHFAALLNRVNVVQELLAKSRKLNVKDKDGCIPLHWAVQSGALEVAQLLCKFHVAPNTENNAGDTPLHMLMEEEQFALLPMLLAHGAFVNKKNNKGVSPFYQAVERGHAPVVRCMIEQSLFCTMDRFITIKLRCAKLLQEVGQNSRRMKLLQKEIKKVIEARIISIDNLLRDSKLQTLAKGEIRVLVNPKEVEQYRGAITYNVIKLLLNLDDAEIESVLKELEMDNAEVIK